MERIVELNDPGRVGFGKDVTFGADVCELYRAIAAMLISTRPIFERDGSHLQRVLLGAHLILLEHLTLQQRLHRVNLSRVDFLTQTNLSKGTFTDDFDRTKVFEADLGSTEA